MAEPYAYSMAKLFSSLVGRSVTFTQIAQPPANKMKQIYGAYVIEPTVAMRVVQADLLLLATFGGLLLGLPSDTIRERAEESRLDEKLRDAIHEVLNIGSTVVHLTKRAVFKNMATDPVYLPKEAVETLRQPDSSLYFEVNVDGYEGGCFRLFSPL
jgi:hypothetical protein